MLHLSDENRGCTFRKGHYRPHIFRPLELNIGLEPTTDCLQGSCSTIELIQRISVFRHVCQGLRNKCALSPKTLLAEELRIERRLSESKSDVIPFHYSSWHLRSSTQVLLHRHSFFCFYDIATLTLWRRFGGRYRN